MTKTPKEKAIELFYTFEIGGWPKENALSAVKEMYNIASLNENIPQMNYLSDVQKEIQKL
jgi:hypothetical protein